MCVWVCVCSVSFLENVKEIFFGGCHEDALIESCSKSRASNWPISWVFPVSQCVINANYVHIMPQGGIAPQSNCSLSLYLFLCVSLCIFFVLLTIKRKFADKVEILHVPVLVVVIDAFGMQLVNLLTYQTLTLTKYTSHTDPLTLTLSLSLCHSHACTACFSFFSVFCIPLSFMFDPNLKNITYMKWKLKIFQALIRNYFYYNFPLSLTQICFNIHYVFFSFLYFFLSFI